MILALDPSSQAIGYAIFDNGKRVEAGVIRPTAPKADALTRSDQMCGDVQALLDEHNGAFDVALIEEPYIPRKAARTNVAAQYQAFGMIWRVLKRAGVPRIVEVNPSTWTGGTNKDARAEDVRRRHGIGAKDDKGNDACDAIGLSEWWMKIGRHRAESVPALVTPRKRATAGGVGGSKGSSTSLKRRQSGVVVTIATAGESELTKE
jgi:Holliday junction resolvasome RuvABC endonuclease subunit